jgi:hypothetical protein
MIETFYIKLFFVSKTSIVILKHLLFYACFMSTIVEVQYNVHTFISDSCKENKFFCNIHSLP